MAGDTAAFVFALNYCGFSNILMFVRHDFDPDGDFKGKVCAEDDVVGKLQNDELSRVLKSFIFLDKIEDLTVLGCHGRAKMSRNLGLYNV